MTNRLWGPFQLLPDCRLWLAEDCINSNAKTSGLQRQLAEAHLSGRDLDRWDRYRPPKKKRQFLSSRLAIRAVLNREFGTASDNYVVEAMESGQPILKHSCQYPMASISLSHTGNMTAIVLGEKRHGLGVDLEIIQPLNVRTLSLTFMNQFEHDWLAEEGLSESPEATLAIWTLKEASWKALGGPSDRAFAEIVAEYRNSTLNGHLLTNTCKTELAATHFFGHQFSFPRALTNYSSIDGLDSLMPGLIGCVVLVDPILSDVQE